MSKYDDNKKKLPDLDKFPTSKKSFLHDIHRKASKYTLSDKQVYAAQKAWDQEHQVKQTVTGTGWKKFTDYQIELLETLFKYLSISWGGSPNSYQFMESLREQIRKKKALSAKQEAALIRKMVKIKKAVMKHIWQGF